MKVFAEEYNDYMEVHGMTRKTRTKVKQVSSDDAQRAIQKLKRDKIIKGGKDTSSPLRDNQPSLIDLSTKD